MDAKLAQSCQIFKTFFLDVLYPCAEDFLSTLDKCNPRKFVVCEKTIVLSSTLHYLVPIWRLHTPLEENIKTWTPKTIASHLDNTLGILGSSFIDEKYSIAHGLSNAIKHMTLDETVHKELTEEYGSIGFNSLQVDNEVVMFSPTGEYLFDFARVILRPVCEAWARIPTDAFDELEDVLEYVANPNVEHDFGGLYDCDDDIDAMINYANPICESCGLDGHDCRCEHHSYDGSAGQFESTPNPHFDFDTVMSRISGAYKKD